MEQRRFDAWGNLADYTAFREGLTRVHPLLDRGYTGHEHLWSIGLIQMNARLYDPLLKRFLSPDNFVPDPYHTQHYNRYGYVLNNPLLYTDPSGNSPFLVILAAQLLFKSIVNLSNGVPFWYGWGRTAAMAVVSHGIGSIVSAGGALADASSTVKAVFQAGAHGLSGGIFNAIDGDSFGSGFLSSSLASAIGTGVDQLGIDNVPLYMAAQIAGGGLSGGLGSVIAGGNFWKGAEQGVIATTYNHAVHGLYNKITEENSMPDDIRFRDSKGRLIATYATGKADADIYLPFKDPLASNINLNKMLENIDLEDLDVIGIGGNWDFTFAMGGGISLEAVYFLDGSNKGQYQIYRTKRQNFGVNGGVGVYAIFADYKGGDKTLNFNSYTGPSFSVSAGIKGAWIGSYSKFWAPTKGNESIFGGKSFWDSSKRIWSGYTVGFGAGAGIQWSRQKTKIYKR